MSELARVRAQARSAAESSARECKVLRDHLRDLEDKSARELGALQKELSDKQAEAEESARRADAEIRRLQESNTLAKKVCRIDEPPASACAHGRLSQHLHHRMLPREPLTPPPSMSSPPAESAGLACRASKLLLFPTPPTARSSWTELQRRRASPTVQKLEPQPSNPSDLLPSPRSG